MFHKYLNQEHISGAHHVPWPICEAWPVHALSLKVALGEKTSILPPKHWAFISLFRLSHSAPKYSSDERENSIKIHLMLYI